MGGIRYSGEGGLSPEKLQNEDGSLLLVVDGEFYGAEVIRAELSKVRRHTFRTKSEADQIDEVIQADETRCTKKIPGIERQHQRCGYREKSEREESGKIGS